MAIKYLSVVKNRSLERAVKKMRCDTTSGCTWKRTEIVEKYLN